jgi:hypothetical protein
MLLRSCARRMDLPGGMSSRPISDGDLDAMVAMLNACESDRVLRVAR